MVRVCSCAVFSSITPFSINFRRQVSRVYIPCWAPVCIEKPIWEKRPSRMEVRIALLFTRSSVAAARPPFLSVRLDTFFESLTGCEDLASSVALELVSEAVDALAVTVGVVVTLPTLPVKLPKPNEPVRLKP